jgi:hypothetical protein
LRVIRGEVLALHANEEALEMTGIIEDLCTQSELRWGQAWNSALAAGAD